MKSVNSVILHFLKRKLLNCYFSEIQMISKNFFILILLKKTGGSFKIYSDEHIFFVDCSKISSRNFVKIICAWRGGDFLFGHKGIKSENGVGYRTITENSRFTWKNFSRLIFRKILREISWRLQIIFIINNSGTYLSP